MLDFEAVFLGNTCSQNHLKISNKLEPQILNVSGNKCLQLEQRKCATFLLSGEFKKNTRCLYGLSFIPEINLCYLYTQNARLPKAECAQIKTEYIYVLPKDKHTGWAGLSLLKMNECEIQKYKYWF